MLQVIVIQKENVFCNKINAVLEFRDYFKNNNAQKIIEKINR